MITVLIVVVYIVLVAVMAVRPHRSKLSEFELRRRLDKKDAEAKYEWRREETWRDVVALVRIVRTLLTIGLVVMLIARFGSIPGSIMAALLLLVAIPLSVFRPVWHGVRRLYDSYEVNLLPRIQLVQDYTKLFRGVSYDSEAVSLQSRDEFMDLCERSDHVLTTVERKMINGAMTFDNKLVRDYMTPRSVMDAIGAHELLGPLVLNDLHKTGHSHFPVLDGDIDHIVGILHIHSLFNLENKKSRMVGDVMEPNVYYIREDQTLADTLAACIKKRRHLLVVINEFRETVGVITIEDAVEQLIGQKIVDQFAQHDDLRAVAARNPRGNNQPGKPTKSSDV